MYFEFLELKGKLILRLPSICCFYQFPKTTVGSVRNPLEVEGQLFWKAATRESKLASCAMERPGLWWTLYPHHVAGDQVLAR